MVLGPIKLVSLPVSDVDRAKDFYVDVLGFELYEDAPMGEAGRWVEVGPADTETHLTLVTWFPTMAAGSLKGLVLATEDIAAARSDLEDRGLHFSGETSEQPWGIFAEFDDPDGNGWVLMQEPPERHGG